MVEGAELPPGFEHRLSVLKYAALQPMTVHLALNEPEQFTVGGGIEDLYWVETGHSNPDEIAQGFKELKTGIPRDDYTDRKSIGWGKRVAGHVDTGCRRKNTK